MALMSSIVDKLAPLSRIDRMAALEALVTGEFKAALLMPDDEELPLSESWFTLGLTSLALSDVKQRLEIQLNCSISTTVLFNSPTVELLLDHLTESVLADLFGPATDAA